MLEELNFHIEKDGKRLLESFHWIILGGESGNDTGKYRYRPSELAWYEKAVEDLRSFSHISIFVKQLGTHLSKQLGFKKDRHGGNIDLFPKSLQIREFPNN